MAAPYNPPKKGEEFITRIGLNDLSISGSFKSSPTISSGDFKIDKDGGGLTNITTMPATNPTSSTLVLLSVSSAEMNGDVVSILGVDQTSPKEWADFMFIIPTTQ
jgi:hypothetical protein